MMNVCMKGYESKLILVLYRFKEIEIENAVQMYLYLWYKRHDGHQMHEITPYCSYQSYKMIA